MKVLVHIDDASTWRDALSQRLNDLGVKNADVVTSQEASRAERTSADYLAAWKPDEALLRDCTNLKGIVNLGAGVDALLANPALPAGVPIVKLRDAGMAELITDYVRYGLLYFQRDFDRYARQQAERRWQPHTVIDKEDWPVGVLGLGAIGAKVAQAIAADGFPVLGWSRSPKTIEGIQCHHGEQGLNQLLGQVKTLVLLLPDTPDTHHLVNASTLAQLPAGASLINPGRGSLVDDTALIGALGTSDEPGHLRGAVLDAFVEEPLSDDSPLWTHPRVLITPHMAGPTPLRDALDQVAESIVALARGKPVQVIDQRAGY